jgi:hypothetical protein
VRERYDGSQSAALVCLVAVICAASRMAVIVRRQGGSCEPGMLAGFAS